MKKESKPDILILMTDQQRYDCLGAAGNTIIRTPNMDRLAAEGIMFTQATTVSPICMPARASFINGRYPHDHGMWDNSGEMPPKDETFFQKLQEIGYFTAHIGKSHYYEHKVRRYHQLKTLHLSQREEYMHARGIEYVHETTGPLATMYVDSYLTDEWNEKGLLKLFRDDYHERDLQDKDWIAKQSPLSVEQHMDSYVGRKAVEFIESYNDERPMCLFVGFPGPHDPYDAPGEYASMYDPHEMPQAIPISSEDPGLPEYVRIKAELKPISGMSAKEVREMRANYYGKISLIDHWFGEIYKAFEKRGRLNDLFIIFWSDHGDMLGDHGRILKGIFKESSVRVPLLMRWPGMIPSGEISDSLVEIIDVCPTILDTVGIEPFKKCKGKSLWPVLKDPRTEIRSSQLSEILSETRNTMIRTHEYKYVIDNEGRGFMLFDLKNDPTEQINLVGKSEAEELERRVKEKLKERLRTECALPCSALYSV